MTRRRTILGVVALAALAAGCAQFEITKVVTPEGASNGPFNIVVDCVPNIPDTLVESSTSGDEQTAQAVAAQVDPPDEGQIVIDELVFNGPGTQSSATFFDESTCTITETQTAGALSVEFACVGVIPPTDASEIACTQIPNGIVVEIGATSGFPGEPTVIQLQVTNRFADPASSVVAEPNFTG